MADQIFNIAKGRDVQFALNVNNNTPGTATLVLLLLTAAEADDTLNNYTTLSALLGAAGNTEATGSAPTNYARKVLTDASSITVTVNNTSNDVTIDAPDQVWTSLGGTTDATFVKGVLCYDETGGGDASVIPMYHFDIPVSDDTTNGQNYTLRFDANGIITQ